MLYSTLFIEDPEELAKAEISVHGGDDNPVVSVRFDNDGQFRITNAVPVTPVEFAEAFAQLSERVTFAADVWANGRPTRHGPDCVRDQDGAVDTCVCGFAEANNRESEASS